MANGPSKKLKLAFALEYSLGHITHADNLKRALAAVDGIEARYLDIPYDNTPLPPQIAPFRRFLNNWSLRASLVARYGMAKWAADSDAAMIHTQIMSLLSVGFMKRVPTIVSIDATPLQYDALGSFYAHETGGATVEQFKKSLNQRAFAAAKHMVSWSQWAKDSLVADYGVPAEKVTVIPPGIDLAKWSFERPERNDGAVRFLFVGGDFPRKGGDTLLAAFKAARAKNDAIALDIVTKSENAGDGEPGVTVHRGLTPNAPALMNLYANADAFAFPTRGDCLPLAIMEALASGLPVITTRVGAIPEAVVDGETGIVVDVDAADQMAAAMLKLAADANLRATMSRAARAQATERFSAETNYGRLVQLLCSLGGR
jgi:glycosyltransferase involved in cell wall biosynthesis